MQPKELQLCTSYIISYRFCHPPLILIQCRMARRCMINYDSSILTYFTYFQCIYRQHDLILQWH
jgi:hypothetical protein